MADTAIVILIGQSLNAWRGSTRELETGNASARQFVGGGTVQEMDYFGTNQDNVFDWNETTSVVTQSETTAGQSPIAGIATTLADAGFTRMYFCGTAVGARGLTTIRSRGHTPNIYGALKRMVALAAAEGDTDPAVYFYMAHGERDASLGTSEADYETSLTQFLQRCQLAAAQAIGDPTYVAPVIATLPVENQLPTPTTDASADIAIKRAIKDVNDSGNVSNMIILPAYHWGTSAGDTVHPTEAQFVLRGEGIGKIIADHIAGTTYAPLRAKSVSLSGDTVTVQFTHNIVRDITTIGDVGSSLNGEDGFEYVDNGSGIGISNISYSGDTATITLASTPTGTDAQQTLKIGVQAQANSGTIPDSQAGTVVRKDMTPWTSTFDATYDNYDWALQEEINGLPYTYTPPGASSAADALIGGVTRSVTRTLTRGVTEGWSWGA